MYISDTGNNRVRRVNLDGMIETLAGTGAKGYSGDNGPGTAADLSRLAGLLVDIDGSLLIADWSNDRVRRVTSDGNIHTAFGGGNGDGFSARLAYLEEPSDAVVTDGGILIADRTKHRIRLVEPSGIMRTIAGNGSPGFSGDGGLATMAVLNRPSRLAVDRFGAIYFTDWGNKRIRRISRSGIITTVAGIGSSGFSEDGTPATDSHFASPIGIAVDTKNNIYVADRSNHVIFKIDSSGQLTRIAGTGDASFNGDGVATESKLNRPEGLAIGVLGPSTSPTQGTTGFASWRRTGP